MLKNNWISVSFSNETTHRLNINLFIVTSWLQKSIRRCNINDSMMYWRELIEAGQLNYIWKRIFIYMVEDIWMWNLYIWEIILKLYEWFQKDKNINHFEEKWIYKAIYLLCISNKNRENDNMISLINKFDWWIKKDKEFIKKYCIESIYNSKSKKKQKEVLNMLDEDFKNYINVDLYNIYKNILIKCWDLNWKDWINLFFINFYLIKKYNIWFNYYKNWRNEWYDSIIDTINNFKFTFGNIEQFKIKDYIFDKHTTKGKKLWRGFKFFFEVWAFLENEVEINWNIYKKEVFKLIKNWVIKD